MATLAPEIAANFVKMQTLIRRHHHGCALRLGIVTNDPSKECNCEGRVRGRPPKTKTLADMIAACSR